MLGKRQDLPNWGDTQNDYLSSLGQPGASRNSSGLFTTKFRFRDHYVKQLAYSEPTPEDITPKPPEQTVLCLPQRGSLTRMSFWAAQKNTNPGEIAYFKCKLPEQNPVPITRELLRHAIEGLMPNHHVQRAVINKEPAPRYERNINTAATLERLRNEVSVEYQKIQSDRQNPENPAPFNAEVKVPSPNKEPWKPKPNKKPRAEGQYKFKDFEDQLPPHKESSGMQDELPLQNSNPDNSSNKQQAQIIEVPRQSHIEPPEQILQQMVQIQPEPILEIPEPKKPQEETIAIKEVPTIPQEAKMDIEEIIGASEAAPKPAEVEILDTIRGRRKKGIKRPNSMEVDLRNFKNKFINHMSDDRILTRRRAQGLDIVHYKGRPFRGKPKPKKGTVVTPEIKYNFDQYNRDRIAAIAAKKAATKAAADQKTLSDAHVEPKTELKPKQSPQKQEKLPAPKQIKAPVSQMQNELTIEVPPSRSERRASPSVRSRLSQSAAPAPSVVVQAEQQPAIVQPPVKKEAVVVPDPPKETNKDQITESKEVPYVPMTNIEVPVQHRHNWKTEVKPRARAGALVYQPTLFPIPLAGVAVPNLPPKTTIFDTNSEKYLSVFKSKPLVPEPKPEPVLVAPSTAPKSVRDEDPLIVPLQSLPTSDPRLSLVPSFDYNPLFSDFNPSSERNKLSYQQSYQPYLVQIFQKGAPVCALEYKFNGEVVHTYDAKVRGMIQQLFDRSNLNVEESLNIRKMVESVIKFTDTIRNEHPSFEFNGGADETAQQLTQQVSISGLHGTSTSNPTIFNASVSPINQADQEIAAKELELALKHNAFRYILLRFSLDIELRLQDLQRLTPQETHMLVAFFNVKFGISESHVPDRLFQDDSKERILSVVNRHIKKVWARTQNFKKNEEFLKKKWKEFLKFVKSIYKDECGLNLPGTKGILHFYADSNKPQVNRYIYEKFHQQYVRKKMVDYQNDANLYRKAEWAVIDDIRWPSPETESGDLNNFYSPTEVQFMKVFFSVKA